MKKSLMIISFAFIFLLSMSIVSAEITGDATTTRGEFDIVKKSVSSGDEMSCTSDSDCIIEGSVCKDGQCVQKDTTVAGCLLGQRLLNGVCVSTSTTGIRESDRVSFATKRVDLVNMDRWDEVKAWDGTKCYVPKARTTFNLFSRSR